MRERDRVRDQVLPEKAHPSPQPSPERERESVADFRTGTEQSARRTLALRPDLQRKTKTCSATTPSATSARSSPCRVLPA
ncbi:hypothetical protein EBB05_17105 [Methylobacterium brachiatum]|nr:hypothetical protein EBB05_17105 [Methylobacterium brachiatum]